MSSLISAADLETLDSVTDLRTWASLLPAAWDAVNDVLGSAPHLRVLAFMPAAAVREAVSTARVAVPASGTPGDADYVAASTLSLTAVEGTQVGLMFQVAQLKLGRTPVDPLAPPPPAAPAGGGPALPPPAPTTQVTTGGAARKVKNNQVLDQTDEAEIPELGQADIDRHFKALERIKGGPVRPEAEPSPDQISAMKIMKVRVQQLDMAPYADFGIFVSHQRRFSKTLIRSSSIICYNQTGPSELWRCQDLRRTTTGKLRGKCSQTLCSHSTCKLVQIHFRSHPCRHWTSTRMPSGILCETTVSHGTSASLPRTDVAANISPASGGSWRRLTRKGLRRDTTHKGPGMKCFGWRHVTGSIGTVT